MNTAARHITGLPLSVPIESLHFLAYTHFFGNLYCRYCALFVRSSLTSHNMLTQSRTSDEPREIFRITAEELIVVELASNRTAAFLLEPGHIPPSLIDHIRWQANRYASLPQSEEMGYVPGIFYAADPFYA